MYKKCVLGKFSNIQHNYDELKSYFFSGSCCQRLLVLLQNACNKPISGKLYTTKYT